MADVLFGKSLFHRRPQRKYGEGVFVGYRYIRRMSSRYFRSVMVFHTRSSSMHLVVPNEMKDDDTFKITVNVRNRGSRAGAETVQLYVGDVTGGEDVVRPITELKAFKKIVLRPGEQQMVSFDLTERDLAYYDAHAHRWQSPSGRYRVSIGSTSRDIRASAEFRLPQTMVASGHQ